MEKIIKTINGAQAIRTYTSVGKDNGYKKTEINKAINQVDYIDFKTDLPMCQGLCIQAVVKDCNIPFTRISKMAIHGVIKNTHGFYALKVKYKNGIADIYIADNGVSSCVVASDFKEVI